MSIADILCDSLVTELSVHATKAGIIVLSWFLVTTG